MADHQRLTSEGVGGEGGEGEGHFSNIFQRGKLAVYCAAQHDFLYNVVFGNAQRFGLFGDLLFNQRGFYKAWANHIGAHAIESTFLGDHAR